jgi:hypothetical protein
MAHGALDIKHTREKLKTSYIFLKHLLILIIFVIIIFKNTCPLIHLQPKFRENLTVLRSFKTHSLDFIKLRGFRKKVNLLILTHRPVH